MDKDFKLPKEFADLEEKTKKAVQEFKKINANIDALGKDKGYMLKYQFHPGNGYNVPEPSPYTEKQAWDLRNQLNEKEAIFLEEAALAVQHLETKKQSEILDKINNYLHPNPYQDLTKEELNDFRKTKKTFEESQKLLDNDLRQSKAEKEIEDKNVSNVVDQYTENFLNKMGKRRYDKENSPEQFKDAVGGKDYEVKKFNISFSSIDDGPSNTPINTKDDYEPDI